MAELLLLALLSIANDRIRGAASEKEYEDTLRVHAVFESAAAALHAVRCEKE